MRKRPKPSAPGSDPGVTISLRSLRNPPLDISLPSRSLEMSVLDLKNAVAEKLGESGTEKIRLLYKKKPCADSKTVKDVVGNEPVASAVEFSVMVIGGSAGLEETKSATQEGGDVAMTGAEEGSTDGPVAQGPSGQEVLQSEEFWIDLKGFLVQRVRDEDAAGKMFDAFRKAWTDKQT